MAKAKKQTARGRKQDGARVAGGQRHEISYEKADRLARDKVAPPNQRTAQAKQAIIREWDEWIRTQPLEGNATGRDALKFFLELKAKRSPTLLEFRSGSDEKWQLVHGWLIDERRVSD